MVKLSNDSYDTGDGGDDTGGWNYTVDEALELATADPDPLCPDGEAPAFQNNLSARLDQARYHWYKALGYEQGDSAYTNISKSSYSCDLRHFAKPSGNTGMAVAIGPIGATGHAGKLDKVAKGLWATRPLQAMGATEVAAATSAPTAAAAPVTISGLTGTQALLLVGGTATVTRAIDQPLPVQEAITEKNSDNTKDRDLGKESDKIPSPPPAANDDFVWSDLVDLFGIRIDFVDVTQSGGVPDSNGARGDEEDQ